MARNTFSLCLIALALAGSARADRGEAIFRERVLPILRDTCAQCHGPLKSAGLDIRTPDGLRRVVLPGSAEKSRLYRLVAGLEKTKMPPARPLDAAQVAAIKQWIDAGAAWSVDRLPDTPPWPYAPVRRPPVPSDDGRWTMGGTSKQPSIARRPSSNPIDRFVFAKLRASGLQPAPPADRRTLIRRASFDLIGLPPSPKEVADFLADRSEHAWEKVVDRLLADPRYGERWARHWLDLARYAESEGFKSDEMRPNAWRYRDYVIQSLNADKPYDRFLKEQIAGDELYPNDPDALIATGFCRHWADESNARNLRQRRQEILNDITDTIGSTVLGLTVGCARCHDHKYDPITQREYYRLQAFFAAIRPRDDIALIPGARRDEYERKLKAWNERTGAARAEIDAIVEPIHTRLARGNFNKFPAEVKDACTTASNKRTAMQWFLYYKAEPQLRISTADIEKAMKPEERARYDALRAEVAKYKALDPGPVPLALGITDLGRDAPATHTLAVGVYDAPKEEVAPGFPAVCGAADPAIRALPDSTGRRSALAEWLASPSNPLTARVMVNRVWQYHFGRGLVGTPSDFGNTGDQAANRELLDWLAYEFAASGWSLKKLHRLIMLSDTYRLSSAASPAARRIDPENRLLSRYNRQRLEGETIRDSILCVSGELNGKMGGPSVMPELPKGLTTRGYWKDTPEEAERHRRSIYVFVKRNLRYPMFELFDMPDTHEPCARREVTTTAPQALALFNNELVLRSAQRLAGRVLAATGSSTEAQVTEAWRLALQRLPTAEERSSAFRFLERQAAAIEQSTEADEPLVSPLPTPRGTPEFAAAALVDLCHTLLNANEFVYIE